MIGNKEKLKKDLFQTTFFHYFIMMMTHYFSMLIHLWYKVFKTSEVKKWRKMESTTSLSSDTMCFIWTLISFIAQNPESASKRDHCSDHNVDLLSFPSRGLLVYFVSGKSVNQSGCVKLTQPLLYDLALINEPSFVPFYRYLLEKTKQFDTSNLFEFANLKYYLFSVSDVRCYIKKWTIQIGIRKFHKLIYLDQSTKGVMLKKKL